MSCSHAQFSSSIFLGRRGSRTRRRNDEDAWRTRIDLGAVDIVAAAAISVTPAVAAVSHECFLPTPAHLPGPVGCKIAALELSIGLLPPLIGSINFTAMCLQMIFISAQRVLIALRTCGMSCCGTLSFAILVMYISLIEIYLQRRSILREQWVDAVSEGLHQLIQHCSAINIGPNIISMVDPELLGR